jgi:hypothetical protein
VGQELALDAQLMDEFGNALDLGIRFGTDHVDVVTISQAGVLRAVGNGETTVRASYAGYEANATVVVNFVAARLEAFPGNHTFTAIGTSGGTELRAFDAGNSPFSVDPAEVEWLSTNEGIAAVSSSGRVLAVGAGTTTVTAYFQAVAVEVPVTVSPQVARLRMAPDSLTLASLGASAMLQVSARDLHGNAVPFEAGAASWESSNVGVVTVEGGRVTAVGNGHAEVSVSVDGVSSSVPVTVEQVVGSVALSTQKVGFTALGSVQTVHVVVFDARGNPIEGYGGDEVTWSSSNDAVFAVSSRGVLTSVSVGTAQLAVRAGGVEALASVTVAQSVASIAMSPSSVTLRALGDTATVRATAFDANGSVIPTTADSFTWAATSPGVVAVSHSGTLTAMGPGLTQISATLGAGQGSASIIASIKPYAVTVGKAGTGTGTVTSTSDGAVSGEINCGPECSRDFHNGATVTLTAAANAGSEFAGWSGAGCFGTGACVIEVSAATSVTAEFAALSTPFIATLYPGIINGGWGVHRTLGYEFTVASPVEVTDLRGRFTGTHAVWIYNVTGGTMVASAVVTATQSSWGVSVLAEPVTLLPGNTYAAAVWHPAGSFQHSMVTPATFGGITIQRSCSNATNLSNPCGPGAEFYPGWIMGQVDFAFRAAPAPGE